MKILSFSEEAGRLVPIELEFALSKGLPIIEWIGNAGRGLKESSAKIRMAVVSQGYKWPRQHRILISMRPHGIRKQGSGIELAVAAGVLGITGQIDLQNISELSSSRVFGELTLSGVVRAPASLATLTDPQSLVWTGADASELPVRARRIRGLSDLRSGGEFLETKPKFAEPPLPVLKWSKEQTVIAALLAHGEFHGFLAGTPGSGKSTFLSAVHVLRQRKTQQNIPAARPHHATTQAAFLGGGTLAQVGLLSRVHRGLLILDEVIEFGPEVLDGLREVIEEAQQEVIRLHNQVKYESEFQLVAASNLCRCGKFNPKTADDSCRCGSTRLRQYLQRLSGPWVDRMNLLVLTHQWNSQGEFSPMDAEDQIARARLFQIEVRKTERPLRVWTNEDLGPWVTPEALDYVHSNCPAISERRRLSILRVSVALADFEESAQVQLRHIVDSLEFTLRTFQWLESASI